MGLNPQYLLLGLASSSAERLRLLPKVTTWGGSGGEQGQRLVEGQVEMPWENAQATPRTPL